MTTETAATMSSEKSTYVEIAVLSLVIAAGITYVFMFQFDSAYSNPRAVLEKGPFKAQYYGGIYAYRPLARDAMLWINDIFFESANFYRARTIVNGFSLMGANLAFLLLLWSLRVRGEYLIVPIVLLDLLSGFTLGVRSNPYTLPSVMLITWGIAATERRSPPLLLACVILGALTHEITLIIVFHALARAFVKPDAGEPRGSKKTERIVAFVALSLFAAIYVGLRLVIETDSRGGGTFQLHTLAFNLRTGPLLVTAMTIALVLALVDRRAVVTLRARGYGYMLWTTAFIVPYGNMMFFVGLMAEFRLFLPFFPLIVVMNLLTRPTPVTIPAARPSHDEGEPA